MLILGNDPTQGLDDTTLNVEKEYSMNFSEHHKKLSKLALQWSKNIISKKISSNSSIMSKKRFKGFFSW